MRGVDQHGLAVAVVLRHALLPFPAAVRAAPELEEGGLEGVERRARGPGARHVGEEMPALVDDHREARVALQRVLHRRVARHLAEAQVRRAARVEGAGDGLERVVLAAGREAHPHHVEVRALAALVLEVAPVRILHMCPSVF